jgi:CPA2 family monovalent cation:H+ antiporter-2
MMVRTPGARHLEALLAAGATDVVPQTLETCLMLTASVLQHVGVSDAEAEQRLRATRDSRYIALRDPA